MSSKGQEEGGKSGQLLDPSLTRKGGEARLKFDLNLMDFNIGGSCSKDDTKRKFKCKYCKNKFSTLQALGGHQNAHRRERAMEKTIHDAAVAANLERVKYMLYPYYSSGISRFPMTTTAPLGKTLGFDVTTAQKPYDRWLNGGFDYGRRGWSKPAAIANQQAASLQQVGNRGFQSFGMTNLNGRHLAMASITANGNHQDGSSEIDLSLKL